MSRLAWWASAGALALLPAGLEAQAARRVLTGVEYYGISFSASADSSFAKSVSVIAIPIGMVWSPSSRLTIDVGTRYAMASHTGQNDSSSTISGLTDTQVRAVYAIRPDVAMFTISANLPTGMTTLENEQAVVAGRIASDLLPYPVSSFGSGSSVTTGLAVAMPVSGWALGLAGSYRVSGSYQPYSSQATTLQPGGEMRVRFGADRVVGQGRFALGMTYSSFAVDEIGSSSYQSGNRIITQASWNFPVGNMGLSLYAWDLYRAGGEINAGTATPKLNLFAVGAGATIQMGRNQLRPNVELRLRSESDPPVDDGLLASGMLLSIGARYSLALGERYMLQPSLRFDTGNARDGVAANVGFTGVSAGVSLRANW